MPAIDREGYRSRKRRNETLFQPPLPFGSSVKATSACSNLRSLSQIQMSSSYRLSSTSPVYGYQKDTFLTMGIPHPTVLRYIVRGIWGHVFLCSINLFVILCYMARQIRIEYPGAIYHITSRGNAQQAIFETKADRYHFLSVLEQACKRY